MFDSAGSVVQQFRQMVSSGVHPDIIKMFTFKVARDLFQKNTFEVEISSVFNEQDYDEKVNKYYLAVMNKVQEHLP